MSNPFVAEIRIFGFNFPPKGWAFCDGQLMAISQNTALFSLLGTTYGGDGKSTFGLPNLMGNAPMNFGQGPGLSLHDLGETGGEPSVTLLSSEVPPHNHQVLGNINPSQLPTPSPARVYARSEPGMAYKGSSPTANAVFAAQAVGPAGGSFPHNNMMPYLVLNFCIALQGVYPARN